jgi:5-methylcytosine-specific restriction endonuclease McrA
MIEIASKEEYNYILNRGYFPLQNWRMFTLPIALRIELQYETFGSNSDFQKQNDKFYRYCWDNMPHYCAETAKPLESYSAVYISHILSRGSNRAMSCDPRNVNILCFEAHQIWESEYNYKMNIWRQNQLIIKLLKNDYNIG